MKFVSFGVNWRTLVRDDHADRGDDFDPGLDGVGGWCVSRGILTDGTLNNEEPKNIFKEDNLHSVHELLRLKLWKAQRCTKR